MILRFDDTNPSKEKHEFVESILEDLKTLGISWGKLSYTSDYFDKMLDYGRDLIKRGLAYVDDTDVELMRKQRMQKEESTCRDFSPDKNLEIFEAMIKGEADNYCLRAKIDMKSNNGCMRDPVLARVNRTSHQRTGKKYIVYPTYDFACPIVDHLEGVTHAMRTNEYADRIPQYYWVLDAFEFPKHEIFEYSRLNLEYTCLSKRKLQWFVETGRVEGWNDPRFPTVRGVIRKGIRVETLTEFMLEQGPSKRSNLMEWEKIWAINKRIIDPICPRFCAVKVEKASRLKITNIYEHGESECVTVPMSKLNLALGDRPLWKSSNVLLDFIDADTLLKVGEKATLMNWGNVMINSKDLQEDGSYLLTGEYLADDKDFKKTAKVTWLADGTNLLIANLIEYDSLIKVKKIEENMDFEQAVNVNSRFSAPYYVDSMVRTLDVNQFLQFERKGYYKIDKVEKDGEDLKYEIIYTPDGKKVGLASQGNPISEKVILRGGFCRRRLRTKRIRVKRRRKKKKPQLTTKRRSRRKNRKRRLSKKEGSQMII
ncbi:UNVERIFIED_CONTAM: hypothetical protein GTU68_045486 [Idotea baltica]|nr:hypothetical protein [Idotea baltica]